MNNKMLKFLPAGLLAMGGTGWGAKKHLYDPYMEGEGLKQEGALMKARMTEQIPQYLLAGLGGAALGGAGGYALGKYNNGTSKYRSDEPTTFKGKFQKLRETIGGETGLEGSPQEFSTQGNRTGYVGAMARNKGYMPVGSRNVPLDYGAALEAANDGKAVRGRDVLGSLGEIDKDIAFSQVLNGLIDKSAAIMMADTGYFDKKSAVANAATKAAKMGLGEMASTLVGSLATGAVAGGGAYYGMSKYNDKYIQPELEAGKDKMKTGRFFRDNGVPIAAAAGLLLGGTAGYMGGSEAGRVQKDELFDRSLRQSAYRDATNTYGGRY